jgi:hypothetical protein
MIKPDAITAKNAFIVNPLFNCAVQVRIAAVS